jgi:hypothetical protein
MVGSVIERPDLFSISRIAQRNGEFAHFDRDRRVFAFKRLVQGIERVVALKT